MLTTKHDCPHCSTTNSGFTGIYAKNNPVITTSTAKHWNVFMECNNCGCAIVIELLSFFTETPINRFGDIKFLKDTQINRIFPSPLVHEAPENLPAQVEKTYLEAVRIIQTTPTGACGMFRRALEIGLKIYDPKDENSKLFERINKLAEEHKITPSLKDWAHRLRLDGNDAMHEVEDASPEDAKQMHLLTKYLLTYLFTLPKQIEDAKK